MIGTSILNKVREKLDWFKAVNGYNALAGWRLSRESALAMWIGGCCVLGYLYLGYHSNLATGIHVFEFLGGHFFIASLVLGYYCYCVLYNRPPGYAPIILWAIVFRIIGVYGSPILEDDYFRYLLDGCVFVTTGTPYSIAPDSMFIENNLPSECQILLSRVNNPALPTIYAPVLQYFFAVAHLISPVNIDLLQWSVSLVDILLLGLLSRYAPVHYVMLYAWSPLVIKEISFTAHPDIIGIALVMAAFHLRKLNKPTIAVGLMALACATKIFAVLMLPFLVWRLAPRYWVLCAACIALLYLPFVLHGATDLSMLSLFVQRWQYNASLFLLVDNYVANWMARVICFGLFTLWYLGYFVTWARAKSSAVFPRGEWVFGMFLLLCPVFHPWYALWLLPFAVLRPSVWAWVLATVLPLSYVSGLHYLAADMSVHKILPLAYSVEVFAVAVALLVDGGRTVLSKHKQHHQ